MKISGFTFVRNGVKLYYPVKESIMSALDLVDEYWVAIGDNDDDDTTREEILSINSDKVKIIDTVWDLEKYPRGMEHAHQTDIAKNACSGDWLLYLQTDELIHEDDHHIIREACKKYLNNMKVEGLLFQYHHFWGDYDHAHISHDWYPKEIRMIRNDPEIHSWESAQSFRRIPDFDGINYRQKENTYKLHVKEIEARIFHYGWVRPPELMIKKKKYFNVNHFGVKRADEMHEYDKMLFDYGPLDKVATFKDTHPKVMKDRIESIYWKDQLMYSGKRKHNRPLFGHERLKSRILTYVEQNFLGGRLIGGFKNYKLLK